MVVAASPLCQSLSAPGGGEIVDGLLAVTDTLHCTARGVTLLREKRSAFGCPLRFRR